MGAALVVPAGAQAAVVVVPAGAQLVVVGAALLLVLAGA